MLNKNNEYDSDIRFKENIRILEDSLDRFVKPKNIPIDKMAPKKDKIQSILIYTNEVNILP